MFGAAVDMLPAQNKLLSVLCEVGGKWRERNDEVNQGCVRFVVVMI